MNSTIIYPLIGKNYSQIHKNTKNVCHNCKSDSFGRLVIVKKGDKVYIIGCADFWHRGPGKSCACLEDWTLLKKKRKSTAALLESFHY